MPTFLHALTVVTVVGACGFFLFAFGASLLWLADVLEHNRHDARRWGRSLIYLVACVLGLLYLVDSYPAKQTLLSAFALLVYLRVITSSPTPSLSAPSTALILGIVLLPITHLSWYWFFLQQHALDVRNRPTYGRSARVERAQEHRHDSVDRLVFYAICVWLVPFYIFLSLSSTPGKPASPSSTPTSALFPPPQESHLASYLHRFLPRKYFRPRQDSTEGILSPRPVLAHATHSTSAILQTSRSAGFTPPNDWSSDSPWNRSVNMASSVPMRRVSSSTTLSTVHVPDEDVFSGLRTSADARRETGTVSGGNSRRTSLSVETSRRLPATSRPVGRSATLGPETLDRRKGSEMGKDDV